MLFIYTELDGSDFSLARPAEAVFTNADLSQVENLDPCIHIGPSSLDWRTLQHSEHLPEKFLRGCGLPDSIIDYLPSLLNEPIQFYSCFISCSTQDEEFAERLHADLQDKGVRCRFSPEDAQAGKKLFSQIDEAIRVHDKLLLILIPASMDSEWVKTEIAKARKLKIREYFIPDFSDWKNHDAYQEAFQRLLRDLKADEKKTE